MNSTNNIQSDSDSDCDDDSCDEYESHMARTNKQREETEYEKVFGVDENPVFCIYLFSFGTAKSMRQSMSVDTKYQDNCIIAKCCMTGHMDKRPMDHLLKIDDAMLQMIAFARVNSESMQDAKAYALNSFTTMGMRFKFGGYEELVIIDPCMLSDVKTMFTHIGDRFGSVKGMIATMKQTESEHRNELMIKDGLLPKIQNDYEKELMQKDNGHEKELVQKDHEHEKEIMQRNHEKELLQKNNELLQSNHEKELMKKNNELLQSNHEKELLQKDLQMKDMENNMLRLELELMKKYSK